MSLSDITEKYVLTMGTNNTLADAIHTMVDFNSFHIPVLKGSKIDGILSTKEILFEFSRNPYTVTADKKLETMNLSKAQPVETTMSLIEAIKMLASGVECLPILEQDILLSIVTAHDIISKDYLWTQLDKVVVTNHENGFEIGNKAVSEDSSIFRAIEQMIRLSTSYLIVIEPDTKLWKGVVTSKDIIRYISRELSENDTSFDFLYRKGLYTMLPHPVIYLSDPPFIGRIREMMLDGYTSIAPIINEEGKLIDIIASRDLLNFLLDSNQSD